ncbi:MAG: hypothetical protein LBT40_10030 [Deltaproteobacteria bacterium]|jgi:hypothetical protein|nr:hypothetical protein [Deltaproteobacteria bacterium]
MRGPSIIERKKRFNFLSSAAPGPSGWLNFDSDVWLPSSPSPAFAMRIHPSFEAGIWYSPNPKVPGKLVQGFSLTDSESESAAYLDIACRSLEQGQLTWLRTGHRELLDCLGNATAEAFRGTFVGATELAAKGCLAGDMRFSGMNRDRVRIESIFGVIRSFVVEDKHYLFSFFCYYPAPVAAACAYTALDNPLFREYGKPSLDSVTFKL